MIFERKDIDVQPAELCIRCQTQNDIPPDIRERGVAICNDDGVWVKGEYAGRFMRIEHDVTDVVSYAANDHYQIVNSTTVSVGISR
jgi:hypothetical protein